MKYAMRLTGLFTVLLTALLSSQAFAAGAASWNCQSDKKSVSATLEASMFGETLTVTKKSRSKGVESITFFSSPDSTYPPGETLMLQDDPNQVESQQLLGSYPSMKLDFILGDKHKNYDLGFRFMGRDFLCVRN